MKARAMQLCTRRASIGSGLAKTAWSCISSDLKEHSDMSKKSQRSPLAQWHWQALLCRHAGTKTK